MSRNTRIIPVLAAAALLYAPALAHASTTNDAATQTASGSGENAVASKDFGKFSNQGSKAMADIDLARLDIFDGQTNAAGQELTSAQAALAKAQTDATVFERAEADLHPPKSAAGQNTSGNSANSPANTQQANATQPIKWLPFGGSMILDENYVATPEKQAAVAKANEQLQQGDKKGAMDTLKLHDIDIAFDMHVVPLEKTTQGVMKASELMKSGKYYEASQVLRAIDDSVRVDEQVYTATPGHQQASAQSGAKLSSK